MVELERKDLPPVYMKASDLAKGAQRNYFRLVRLQVGLSVVSAGLLLLGHWVSGSAQLGAAAAGLAVLVTVGNWLWKPDRKWHRNRALAEFIKSQAWRYAMGVAPYAEVTTGQAADAALQEAIAVQAERWPETRHLAGEARDAAQVSEVMRRVRSLPLPERMDTYRQKRVADQRQYYGRHASDNGSARDNWYVAMLVAQLAVVPVALMQSIHSLPVSWLGILTAIPAAIITWLRARRYEDLAPSYAVAGKRLADLASEADQVQTEKEFGVYVSRVEGLLTREHEEWLIRRS